MSSVVFPLRAGIGGRLVGFVCISVEADAAAFQSLATVDAKVILRGRSEGKSSFLERAKRVFGTDTLPVTE
jgi:hypothetical protein